MSFSVVVADMLTTTIALLVLREATLAQVSMGDAVDALLLLLARPVDLKPAVSRLYE